MKELLKASHVALSHRKLHENVARWIAEAELQGSGDPAKVVAVLQQREASIVFAKVRDTQAEVIFYRALLTRQADIGSLACAAARAHTTPTAALDVFSTVRHMWHAFAPAAATLSVTDDAASAQLTTLPAELCTELKRGAPPLAPVADALSAQLAVAAATSTGPASPLTLGHGGVNIAPEVLGASVRKQLEVAGPYLARTTDSVKDERVEFMPDRWQVRFFNLVSLHLYHGVCALQVESFSAPVVAIHHVHFA
jgi:hypothetical protein